MKRSILAITVGITVLAPVASSQPANANYVGEILVTADGKPAAPWVERELCRKTTGRCEIALTNTETGEVAMVGDILGTDFERTQNGKGIQRAETAMAKALRLRAAAN